MNGVLVPLKKLPSQGCQYPEDMELYVTPLSIKDQIDMDRYGISDSDYFKILLKGITLETQDVSFGKNKLIHFDVQFLDIVRRLITFDTNDKITIEGAPCRKCGHKINYTFKCDDLVFTDFNPDIFGKTFILKEGTEDELEFTVSPLTTFEYTNMSREFRNFTDKNTMMSQMYTAYLCAVIREIKGRKFQDLKDRNAFLTGYFDSICTNKDKKVLDAITDETIVKLKPFSVWCDNCLQDTEVEVTPTSNFQQ